jgi:uncharacterized protein (TIGR02246 family)
MSRSEIAAVNRQFEHAAASGDLDGLAALYTPDAIALPPGAPLVVGREWIREMWAGIARQLGLKAVALTTLDLEIARHTAHEVGEARLTLATGASTVVKFVVVWKKVDGQWRLHRDIWNDIGA